MASTRSITHTTLRSRNDGVLFINGKKLIEDYTLVALTIMIAESRPDEMEMMTTVIMNCIRNIRTL